MFEWLAREWFAGPEGCWCLRAHQCHVVVVWLVQVVPAIFVLVRMLSVGYGHRFVIALGLAAAVAYRPPYRAAAPPALFEPDCQHRRHPGVLYRCSKCA